VGGAAVLNATSGITNELDVEKYVPAW